MVASLLNKLSLGPSRLNPTDDPSNVDFINALDYDDLERRFQIHKYYPKFIHNYDVSTPTIRSMICDKPIYLKANSHVKNWKNPGTRKTYITELDLDTGEAAIKEKDVDTEMDSSDSKRLAKKIRKEARRQRHEEKRIQKDEKTEEKGLRKQERTEEKDLRKQEKSSERDDRKQRHEEYKQLRKDQALERKEFKKAYKPHHIAPPPNQIAAMEAAAPPRATKPDMMFRNPFDLEMATLVPSENPNHRSRQPSYDVQATNGPFGAHHDEFAVDGPKKRNNSIASRFMGMVKPEIHRRRSSRFNNPLEPVHTLSSYDATKSTMTLNRSNVTNMLKYKLNENAHRRQSEQIGTY